MFVYSTHPDVVFIHTVDTTIVTKEKVTEYHNRKLLHVIVIVI